MADTNYLYPARWGWINYEDNFNVARENVFNRGRPILLTLFNVILVAVATHCDHLNDTAARALIMTRNL